MRKEKLKQVRKEKQVREVKGARGGGGGGSGVFQDDQCLHLSSQISDDVDMNTVDPGQTHETVWLNVDG